MSVDSAHKSNWAIGEVVFGIPFLFGLVLHFLIPFSPLQGINIPGFLPVGIVLIVLGLRLITLARREFAAFHQPTDPGQATSKIVKTGVFAVSRNPLYLGAVLVLLGLALAFNLIWAMIMLLLSMILCHYVLILPEEHYLAAKFGDDYDQYKASVHRWYGRK